ncbi:hypothetical protein KS4_35600 [Poriferisphaera corsica]|uniref:AsmA domain-containing protein n=1 Tax=Poriferisphaera corsica TaxID=2528020 RepID=A0A517YZ37_9BACT|nr:hypothetical protein [Poriferisphaera corsica]QDU35477.1 hypothetical protein KS4_35600 [Poriferisphaera corsica]
MKWIIRSVIALLIVVLIIVSILYIYIDTIARRGIEYAANYATGTKSTLAAANVGILKGSLTLTELKIYNPPSFGDTTFFDLKNGKTAVELSTLRQDTVVIPLLELNDLNLNIISNKGSTNYQPIFDHMSKLQEDAKKSEQGDTGSQKGFVINEILITDIKVNVDYEGQNYPVKIPKIQLKDIGSGTDSGVVLSQVTGIIIEAIMKSVIENAPEVLPKLMLNGLQNGVNGIGDIGSYSSETLGNIIGNIPGGQELNEAIKGSGKSLEEGFGNLFGGSKEEAGSK